MEDFIALIIMKFVLHQLRKAFILRWAPAAVFDKNIISLACSKCVTTIEDSVTSSISARRQKSARYSVHKIGEDVSPIKIPIVDRNVDDISLLWQSVVLFKEV